MEEEATRREAGELSDGEIDPSWLMKKDAAPSTIYEIFSNNVGTFNPDSPSSKQTGDYNPFSPDTSAAGAASNLENGGVNNGGAAPTHSFGSYGQASGEEFDLSVGLPVSNTPDPTMEDVESALAELDSLPDGENERDDEDADRWRAEEEVLQQKQPEEYLDEEQHYNYNRQSPLSSPTAFAVNTESLGAAALETSSEQRNGAGSGTSSPRSVEGFITSVELNTAQEQLLADSTAAVEAPSGPYSVYVSSSPEPASLDHLVEATSASAVSHSLENREVSPVVMDTHSEVQSAAFEESVARVEIVHAQSTVEVVAPPSPTHEPELVFTSQPAEPEPVPTPSPVYTHAPLNEMMAGDLMSTSMILEQPISDAPEQVQEMMQFMTSSNDIVYNSLEQQQTAEFVHITSESERRFSPQMEAANLLDTDDGEHSYHVYSPTQPQPCSPIREEAVYNPTHSAHSPVMAAHEAAASPVASPLSGADDSLIEQMNRANLNDSYPAERAMSPEQGAAASPSPVPSAPVSDVVPSTPVKQPVIDDKPVSPINTPKQDMPVHDEDIVSQIAAPAMDLDEVIQDTDPLHDVEDFVTHEDAVEERLLSPVHMAHTPVSDVVPSTPIKEPLINDRPISPIHTPKSAMTPHDDDIISKIDPPALEKEAKKAPVKPAPRTTPAVASRSRPLSAAAATKTATPTTTNVKPGTPRPSARTAPGSAVRSTATTNKTATPAARTTPTSTGRTPLSSRTTPVSRSASATSTSATRTTTTARTPMSSRTATPSATRTTPSSSATRTTPSAAASRPTPTTRTTRPSTTPTSTTARTMTAARTPSSRPSSAATTPTTARRAPISRRTPTATTPSAAKDVTDSSKSAASATTKPSTTARVPLTRKPLYPGPKTTTTAPSAAAKPAPSDKKEIKNTTNKLLSTRTSTLTRTTASTAAKSSVTAPTHKPLASKTAAAPKRAGTTGSTTLKSRTTTTTTKTVSKSKTGVDNATEIITTTTEEKKEVTSPETNGEVKIAQEEISVEVESKEETEQHFNGDAAEPVEVMLVNGDH